MDIETVLGDFAAVAPNAAERATFFSTLASNSELQTAVYVFIGSYYESAV